MSRGFVEDDDNKNTYSNHPSDSLPLLRRSTTSKTMEAKTAMSTFQLLDDSASDEGRALEDGHRTYQTLTKEHLNEEKPSSSFLGRIILLVLALVYGSLNISMRLVFGRPDPPTASASSTIQGWFSVVCFLPLLSWRSNGIPRCKGTHPTASFWRFALELAFFNFGTQALINMSLVATQGARASFLVQMSVVFTPVLSVIFGQQTVSPRVWSGCFVALAGLFVLSYSEAEQQQQDENDNYSSPSLALSWGDWCCLLAALCWSLYIYRLSAWGEYFDETMTQFVKNIVLAALYTIWMLISLASRQYSGSNEESLWNGWKTDPIAWLILFYSALGPCTLADVFQQKAQSSVPAAETNVILSLEPVFTTLLGLLLLGEIPSLQEICGGLLIMIASFIVSLGPQAETSTR